MAHLWVPQTSTPWWAEFPLTISAYALCPGRPLPMEGSGSGPPGGALLLPSPRAKSGWLLLVVAPARARVNGAPLLGGLRVLHDRDELRVAGVGTLYFSTEMLARIESAPGGRPLFCPRCKLAIGPGTDAVRCPGENCGAWHHQSAEMGCWLYAPTCALCPQPTSFEAGYRWTPGEIGS